MILKAVVAAIVSIAGVLILPQHAHATAAKVVISELQTQSATNKTHEFIEISNISSTPQNLTGWKITYQTATGSTTSELAGLEGQLQGDKSALFSRVDFLAEADGFFDKGLSESGGHVILTDASGTEIDRVGWGGALYPKLSTAAPPDLGKSLQRKVNVEGAYINTGNNGEDFIAGEPSPQGGGIEEAEAEETPLPCEQLLINEILPNPQGSDATNEFVELFNPTDTTISGQGCALETDKGTKVTLDEVTITAKGWQSIGLSNGLLNSGGEVRLVGKNTEQSVTYPKIGEGQAWAKSESDWQLTDNPTPGQANIISSIEETETITATVEPCPEGKYRHPETNRCRNIVIATTSECEEGQERNPETGRCRKVAQTQSSSTACPVGQERNPATNRCRKIASETALQPCPTGQERNPETGRCRKVAQTSGTPPPSAQQTPKNRFEWTAIIFAAIGIVGLVGFEYRNELKDRLQKLVRR